MKFKMRLLVYKWVHHQTSAVNSWTRTGITFRNTQSKHKYERQTVEVKDPTHVKPSFVKELTTWYLRLHYQRFLKTWLNFSSRPVQAHDSDDRWRSRPAHLNHKLNIHVKVSVVIITIHCVLSVFVHVWVCVFWSVCRLRLPL